ncbi:MAG TPA: response regulator [Herpetosiphonaceae bacterium]
MTSILVVDDNRDIATFISFALRARGHAVRTADDGVTALYAITRDCPELVICDVALPYLSGAQLCRILQADLDYRHVAFIFMSGNPESSLPPRIGSYAAFLDKPFELKLLCATVEQVAAALPIRLAGLSNAAGAAPNRLSA